LDTKLNLKAGDNVQAVNQAIKGHILAIADLCCVFAAGGAHIAAQAAATEVTATAEIESASSGTARQAARLRELETDKEFLIETEQRAKDLKAAYAAHPETLRNFFRKYPIISPFRRQRIAEFLREINDPTVRRALEDYWRYAYRFRVSMRLNPKILAFEPRPWSSGGKVFDVKIVEDHLEGRIAPGPDEAYSDYFESPGMHVPPTIRELIEAGKAKFVRIEDPNDYSILQDLESFAYKDDGVALFVHQAEQPYLGCIFGEKMAKQTLAQMGKAVSEFQKTNFSRVQGGRPRNTDRLKRELKVDQRAISNKAKAAELADGGDEKKVKAEEVRLSRQRSKRRKAR
jgi:hypothetical protein